MSQGRKSSLGARWRSGWRRSTCTSRAALTVLFRRRRWSAVTSHTKPIVTSSIAGHAPIHVEPVYTASKWAVTCFVQTMRRQLMGHGIRVGQVSPGPVISALLSDWEPERLQRMKDAGALIEPVEVADALMYMLTRPRNVTIRDMIVLPSNFDV